MSTRYADPARCPDCVAALPPGSEACPHCGLPLRGEVAARLYASLALADQLLATLRAARVPAAATPPFPTVPGVRDVPAYPAAAAPRRASAGRSRRGWRTASVPAVLLTLGAGCLLVAAVVFLAVAWSVLGVGGRTATLVVLTAVAGGLAAWLARRGVRAAAESLTLVGLGLLGLDVVGADHAGWLGDPSTPALLGFLGSVLAAVAAAAACAARWTPVRTLVAAELAAVVGVALAATGVGSGQVLPTSTSLLLAVAVPAGAVVLARSVRLRVTATGAAAVTGVSWLVLTGYALERLAEHDRTWATLWERADAWPLLAAASLAAVPVGLRRCPMLARVAAAAVAEPLAVWAALAPAAHLPQTGAVLVALGVLVLAAVPTALARRPWGLAQAGTQTAAGLVALVVTGALVASALDRALDAAVPVWAGAAGDRLPTAPTWAGSTWQSGLPAPWLLPVCLVALAGTGWALRVADRTADRVLAPIADPRLGAAALAGSLAAALLLLAVPVWLVLTVLLAAGAGLAAWWWAGRSPGALALSSLFLPAGLVLSLHAAGLSAAALAVTVTVAAWVHLAARGRPLATAAGAVLAVALAADAATWAHVAGATPTLAVLAGLLVLAVLVPAAPYAPGRWWAVEDPVRARAGLEVGAVPAAAALAVVGALLAPTSQVGSWLAVYLTVAGASASVVALLRRDRRAVGWAGGLLLAAATWVRLWDQGVRVPEAYTLPTAAALLAVGLVRLRRDGRTGTLRALGPGLGLALTPSLLWALREPAGPRELLLGVGCLALVLAGARLRWTAPVAAGAVVGGLLVVRLAAPYVGDSVPRWVLIGLAGALLVTIGATWERRLQEARQVVARMRTLR